MNTTTEQFGYTPVPEGTRQSRVNGVFSSVASSYDIMNDAMSGGLHRLWKKQFVSGIGLRPGEKHLDVAGGTGDIARASHQKGAIVTACDINADMLSEGRKTALNKGIQDITWITGTAEALPFPDQSFDACTIAFGLRNVSDRPKALRDMRRILKPGGRFHCLEFSQMSMPWLQKCYDTYSFNVIPKLGKLLANDADSYQYLVESIRLFPAAEQLQHEMRDAGFYKPQYKLLQQGVVAIHHGWRI